MRIVIFFGLLSISDAIGKQTGWEMGHTTVFVGSVIFCFAIVLDIIDALKAIGA